MHETKVIGVLRKFSTEEMKEFGWFVNSPFHNRIKNVTKLFEAIKKFHPAFESRFINKKYVYKRITGNGSYNDAVMRNLCSDLYKLAGDYLAIRSYKSKPTIDKMTRLVELRRSQHDKNLLMEFEKVKETIEKARFRDEDYYYENFLYWNKRNNSFAAKSIESFQQNIHSEISEFAHYFIIHLIDRYHQAHRHRTSYKTFLKNNFLSDTVNVLRKYGFMDAPVIKALYHMFMLVQTNLEEHYLTLKELMKDNFGYLSPYSRFIIFQSLQVFFMNCERQGITAYRRDRFEIYKNYAATKDLIYDNELADASYTSAVVAAIQVKEYDWAVWFTEEFRKYLAQNLRQDAYYYNYARILHAQKRNEEALGYLARVIPTHHPIKAVVKVVELQILFELERWESVFLKLDSLRHFFSKNEAMSQTMRSALGNFYKLYTMFVDLKTKDKGPPLGEIKKEIERIKYSYSMEWFKEQLALNK